MGKLYEDLVGMANTDGGCLFLGLEDDGTPTGVNTQHTNLQSMEASIQDHTVPSLFVHTHMEEWDEKSVLVIEVPISRQLMIPLRESICVGALSGIARRKRLP